MFTYWHTWSSLRLQEPLWRAWVLSYILGKYVTGRITAVLNQLDAGTLNDQFNRYTLWIFSHCRPLKGRHGSKNFTLFPSYVRSEFLRQPKIVQNVVDCRVGKLFKRSKDPHIFVFYLKSTPSTRQTWPSCQHATRSSIFLHHVLGIVAEDGSPSSSQHTVSIPPFAHLN